MLQLAHYVNCVAPVCSCYVSIKIQLKLKLAINPGQKNFLYLLLEHWIVELKLELYFAILFLEIITCLCKMKVFFCKTRSLRVISRM